MEKINNLPSLIFLLIGIVFAGMIYLQDLSTAEGLQSKLSQVEAQLVERTASLKKAQNSTQEISSIKSEIEKSSHALSLAEGLAPKELTMISIMDVVSKEAKDAGIRVVSSKPKTLTSMNFYDEVPLEANFEGSYSQLTMFMYMLSKQNIILHAKDIDLSVKEIVDGQTNLKMKTDLVGFRYKEAPR